MVSISPQEDNRLDEGKALHASSRSLGGLAFDRYENAGPVIAPDEARARYADTPAFQPSPKKSQYIL
jgi:hypothetical protein